MRFLSQKNNHKVHIYLSENNFSLIHRMSNLFSASWAPVIVYVLATVIGIWLKEVVGNRTIAKNLAALIQAELEYDKQTTLQRLQKILSIPPEDFKPILAKDPLHSFLSTFKSNKSNLNLLPPEVVQTLFKLEKFRDTVFENFFSFFLQEMAGYEAIEETEDEEMINGYSDYLGYVHESVQQKIFIIEDLMDQLLTSLEGFQRPFYKKSA